MTEKTVAGHAWSWLLPVTISFAVCCAIGVLVGSFVQGILLLKAHDWILGFLLVALAVSIVSGTIWFFIERSESKRRAARARAYR